MNIAHHEKLNYHRQRENFLVQSLHECSMTLDKALILLSCDKSVQYVPSELSSIAMKYREMIEQINTHHQS